MIPVESLIAAFILGLMGAGHCLGMCGGIAGALAFAIPNTSPVKRILLILGYNLGRAVSYSIMGAMAGFLGGRVAFAAGVPLLKIISSLLLIAMGFYLANWWRILTHLEKVGAIFWRYIQPFGRSLLPVSNGFQAILLGLVWGWLPCGLVYSSLVFAASKSSVLSGASIMFAFALGTLPAIFIGGLAGQTVKQFINHTFIRVSVGLAFMGFGLWQLFGVIVMLTSGAAAGHHH